MLLCPSRGGTGPKAAFSKDEGFPRVPGNEEPALAVVLRRLRNLRREKRGGGEGRGMGEAHVRKGDAHVEGGRWGGKARSELVSERVRDRGNRVQ